MKISFAIILFLLSFTTFAQKLVITPLNDKLYVYTTYHDYKGEQVSANSMYLVTQQGVILFDTPWDQKQNQPLLDSILKKHGKPIIKVFATHSHEDRAGGFGFFNARGITTYASIKTNKILRTEQKPTASNTFLDSERFNIGGETFEVRFFGAGHTKDNLVVWFPKYRILDGGCLVKSASAKNLGYIGEADLTAWPKTILAIKGRYKKINLVIAGHDDWKEQGALEKTLQLLKEKN